MVEPAYRSQVGQRRNYTSVDEVYIQFHKNTITSCFFIKTNIHFCFVICVFSLGLEDQALRKKLHPILNKPSKKGFALNYFESSKSFLNSCKKKSEVENKQ